MQNWLGYPAFKSVITGFSLRTQSGVQFMHTLSDFIYVYVFGERISDATLTGYSFAHSCDRLDEQFQTNGGRFFLPNFHGLEYVINFYNLNRVTTSGAPITIVLGMATVIYGFLIGTSIDYGDTERQIAQFNLAFKTIPQTTLLDLIG